MFYSLREKAAYSFIGKVIATALRNTVYKNSRTHWIQQAFADGSFAKLK